MKKRGRPKDSSEGLRLVRSAVRSFRKSGSLPAESVAAVRSHAQAGGLADLYQGLWEAWRAPRSARARLCAVLLADELFGRSVAFRRLLCADLWQWCEQTVGPTVPDEDGQAETLKTTALSCLSRWNDRFVPTPVPAATTEYTRQLHLVVAHLRGKFEMPLDQSQQERDVERERRRAEMEGVKRELREMAPSIESNVTEMENALNVLFPTFEERFQMEDDAQLLRVEDVFAKDDNDKEDYDNDGDDWEDEDEAAQAATSKEMRIGGLTDDFAIDVSIAPSKDMRDENDAPLVRAVKDAVQVLVRSHMPKLEAWQSVFRNGEEEGIGVAAEKVDALLERAKQALARANNLVK